MSNLGISDRPSLSIESACGSGSVSFREAYANVAAGFYDVALVAGVEKVHILVQSGLQLTFHIVQIFFMRVSQAFPSQDYLHQWREPT